MINVHAIQTGRVKVKQFQATGAKNLVSRLWQLFFTEKWSDWQPIYCWLVEHPDGPFLIDTGEIAKVHEPGYLPDNVGFKSSVQYDVKREDEVDIQLGIHRISSRATRGVLCVRVMQLSMNQRFKRVCRLSSSTTKRRKTRYKN